GIISSACARRVLALGHELDLLVRGHSHTLRPYPDGARLLHGDIRDPDSVRRALDGETYDVVVDFIAFTPSHIELDLELFRGRTGQFVFISSASAYHKPVRHLPITESTPLHNPFWRYSRNKIACEERLMRAYREEAFPITIVRPSHTYDRTLLPFEPHGPTVLRRILDERPVVLHGDGTSLWTLTHHADFAVGFAGLLGHPAALGEAFHITSDEVLPWNEVYHAIGRAAGKEVRLVHVPSDRIARVDPDDWGAGVLGDKSHSVLFDNSKIKRLVPNFVASTPWWRGAREIVEFYAEHPELLVADPASDRLVDQLVAEFG
ncbi:MAG TPA: NAD-dependent epimerase/dehydratase family protein, partial [Polyangiaceae bacterium]|nr:NAD-dependent epimerase/dehydratase family protein [Polyangiaceae bacterium]